MAKDLPYKEGTIKLTWIDPKDFTVLNSDMFNTVEDAVESAKNRGLGKDYLIMKLVKTNGKRYEWILLNEGEYSRYITGMKISKNPVLKYGSMALMALGVIYVLKMVVNTNK